MNYDDDYKQDSKPNQNINASLYPESNTPILSERQNLLGGDNIEPLPTSSRSKLRECLEVYKCPDLLQAMFRTKTLEDLKREESEEAQVEEEKNKKANVTVDGDSTAIPVQGAASNTKALKKCLNAFDLIAYGVGSTVGAGIFVTAGVVANQETGPAIVFSFLVAGFASLLSAFCYAEFAARIPASGSAFTFTYASLGELVAWFIGWNLTLEYAISASAVARGWSGYVATLFSGFGITIPDYIYGYNVSIFSFSPLSAFIIAFCTVILLFGVKDSSRVNMIITILNFIIISFVIIFGAFYVKLENWKNFFPFGVSGVFRGAGTVFFSYVGFDAVTTLAEEVKSPQRDLPIGIIGTLGIATAMYVGVSLVLTGMVNYTEISQSAPLSQAFVSIGYNWASIIISLGTATTLTTTVLCSLLGQPRIFYRMSKDGLLFKFMGKLNKRQVPVTATIVTGIFSGILAFTFGLDDLANMISIGTLLAFSVVCSGVVILRYKTKETPYKPTILIVLYWIACTAFCVVFHYAPIDWYYKVIFLGPILLIVILIFFMQTAPGKIAVKAPLVPFTPCLGILINTFMIAQLPIDSFIRVLVWTVIGNIIYFFYGVRYSTIARSWRNKKYGNEKPSLIQVQQENNINDDVNDNSSGGTSPRNYVDHNDADFGVTNRYADSNPANNKNE